MFFDVSHRRLIISLNRTDGLFDVLNYSLLKIYKKLNIGFTQSFLMECGILRL